MTLLCMLAVLLALLPTTFRYARAASLLWRVTDPSSKPLPFVSSAITERLIAIDVDGAALRARVYAPQDEPDAPGILLLHGVHPRGIDETRLIAFARSLAETGVVVLTPELPELIAYRIDAGTVDHIASIARALSTRLHVDAVGVMGISFAGGLALMAAVHAPDAHSIAFVVTLGAHEDLERLCRYYAGEAVRGPDGEAPSVKPHPYGARVMLREHLHRLFAAEDLALARDTLDTYLHDQPREARERARALSPAGRRTMGPLLNSARSQELAELLTNACALTRSELSAASPRGKLQRLRVPVFLIHGQDDPVIPSIETRWLARDVPTSVLRATVITPLLRHAEFPTPPTAAQARELITLMAEVLREAGATRFSSARTSP